MISHVLCFLLCCGFALTAQIVKYINKASHKNYYDKLNNKLGIKIENSTKQNRLDLIHLILVMVVYSISTTLLISLLMGSRIDPEVQRYTKKGKYLTEYQLSYFVLDREVFKDIFYVMIINTVLFAGKWYYHYKMDRFNKQKHSFKKSFTDLNQAKALWIAPFLEEYVYRVLCLYIYAFNTDGNQYNYLLSGALFSLSHQVHYIKLPQLTVIEQNDTKLMKVYHYIINFVLSQKTMLKQALGHLQITFIFGTYSSLVIVRTQSIWPVFQLHSYCNWIEGIAYLPDYQNYVNDGANKKIKSLYIGGIIGWIILVFYVRLI